MSRVGSDTGGTFTDLVRDDGTVVKVPSTPTDPAAALRDGLDQLAPDLVEVLTHGTTVATNALLERRGALVGLVTNAGFADIVEIGRQDRPSLYDQRVDRPATLVPRAWRYEVGGRLDARGIEIEPIDPASLGPIDPAIEVMAICLLHSDLNSAHEKALQRELAGRGIASVASYEISPEFREYERTITVVVNAYLRAPCRPYLRSLHGLGARVGIMTSAGGLTDADDASERPAALLLSGPAGGVLAGAEIALANGFANAITFDMGGTSTDVCLITDGSPEPAAQREVAGFPVRLPALDVHTIGAGGGSIAGLDEGGALLVGPRSAGAVPGPACYGRGGLEPTVTDANLVLGRLPLSAELPGIGTPDLAAARAALDAAGIDAGGVVAVVNAAMERALRSVSVERGVDPRRLALVAFGGSAPLHACELADALAMPIVVVPPRAGVFSAVGILGAPHQVDLVESWSNPLDHHGLVARARVLAEAAAERVRSRDGGARADSQDKGVGPALRVMVAVDCRYEGQSHELRTPLELPALGDGTGEETASDVMDRFHAEHERRNGYCLPEAPVEVITLRVSATLASPVGFAHLPDPTRACAVGPAVIAEPDCTIWVPSGWRADPGVAGAMLLRRTSDLTTSDATDKGTTP